MAPSHQRCATPRWAHGTSRPDGPEIPQDHATRRGREDRSGVSPRARSRARGAGDDSPEGTIAPSCTTWRLAPVPMPPDRDGVPSRHWPHATRQRLATVGPRAQSGQKERGGLRARDSARADGLHGPTSPPPRPTGAVATPSPSPGCARLPPMLDADPDRADDRARLSHRSRCRGGAPLGSGELNRNLSTS